MAKRILNQLKLVLKKQDVTGRELTKGCLRKTEFTVSIWCTNDKQPSDETLYQIAQYLDFGLHELFVQM